jgi:hypothetical protein
VAWRGHGAMVGMAHTSKNVLLIILCFNTSSVKWTYDCTYFPYDLIKGLLCCLGLEIYHHKSKRQPVNPFYIYYKHYARYASVTDLFIFL